MNLQMARKKKILRRERMQKLAEMRKATKIENGTKTAENVKPKSEANYDVTKDYFLGDREETETETVVISLRLTSLMKHLYDGKISLCNNPASIRDKSIYPLFNSIKHISKLVDYNPVFWDEEQVLTFIQHFTTQIGIVKRFENQQIDGEAILNLNKADLLNYFELDENSADAFSTTFNQLKKETIMRYVNS